MVFWYMSKKNNSKNFNFTAKVWLYPTSKAAWHFASIPKKIGAEIKFLIALSKAPLSPVKVKKAAWGSVKVLAKIGNSEWETSIFPDKNTGSYILPLKAEIRKNENIKEGKNVKIFLEII
jgi:hypothetical protein